MTSVAHRIAALDAWLETMRQPGGYGGPVVHWWQHSTRFCAPGLDWRYEGLLAGYAELLRKTGDPRWHDRLARAASDLLSGRRRDGGLHASGFERNPCGLGTPHEAAASLGLVLAVPWLVERAAAAAAVSRILNHLVERLWDGRGFDDRPGVPGRVPNKLATLAQAMLGFVELTGEEDLLPYARAALEDVLRFQVARGPAAGAIHQYASGPRADRPDGRFFPYYNARCIPPLVAAARRLERPEYRSRAEDVLDFLERTMDAEGSWPQIVYASGRRADRPRWIAGAADILLAYDVLDREPPEAALARLLAAQLPSGGFPTAEGFAPSGGRDWRDMLPVVGWNDKVLRLLARLLPRGASVARREPSEAELPVRVAGTSGRLLEGPTEISIVANDGTLHYRWRKREAWARNVSEEVGIR